MNQRRRYQAKRRRRELRLQLEYVHNPRGLLWPLYLRWLDANYALRWYWMGTEHYLWLRQKAIEMARKS